MGTGSTLFTFGGTNPQGGGTYTYGSPAPVLNLTSAPALHAMLTAPAPTSPEYVGFGLYFNSCVDASMYTGVQFTIAGTVTGCMVQFSANYSEDAATTDPKGTCTGSSCYSSQYTVASIPATASPVMVLFSQQTEGMPAAAVDKGKLVGVQWQFTVPMGMACMADVTISNVSFF
jgi:hypothetical protein